MSILIFIFFQIYCLSKIFPILILDWAVVFQRFQMYLFIYLFYFIYLFIFWIFKQLEVRKIVQWIKNRASMDTTRSFYPAIIEN